MDFLIDAQLPPNLAHWLTDRGHSARHVYELGYADSEDAVIWSYAVRVGAVIITKDEDFAERTARSVSGPVIVWFRIGNSTNQALIQWLEPRWPTISQLLNDGVRLIEVR